MQKCCPQPFTALEIGDKGNVFTCCPSFINNYKIGSIFESDAAGIWYGEKAAELRKKILNGDYSLCSKNICRQFKLFDAQAEIFRVNPPMPEYVTLAYDRECNLCCITCRNEKIKNSQEQIDAYNKRIENVLIPLIKNARILALSGGGEALYSSHSRLLIKKTAAANKKIMFNINTNGILFNEKNLKELGIFGRINEVFISLPALDENLYKQIMLGSDLKTAVNNIKSAAAEQGKSINKVTINSVISKLNYGQIPALVKFAKQLNIYITLSPFEDWGTKFAKEYDYDIWNKSNNEHNKFTEIMQNLEYYERLMMPPLFSDLINKEHTN